jgi:hypothetical protein
VRGEGDQHAAAVLGISVARHQAALSRSIDKLHGGVVADLQPGSDVRHGGGVVPPQAPQRQEQLVVLGLDASGASKLLAQVEESA